MKFGYPTTLAYEPWPEAGPEPVKAQGEFREYPVQINGKLCARVMAAADLKRDELFLAVKAEPKVQRILANSTVVKEVTVPGRLVNFVVKE